MASFFEELKGVAAVAADKAKDVAYVAADKAKDAAELTKINMAIASEEREMDKNYRAIGEWIVNEYVGEIPEEIQQLVEEIKVAKGRIADLERSKPRREERSRVEDEPVYQAEIQRICPICGEAADSKFCPKCGAPMGD